jgi:hypothetical protein
VYRVRRVGIAASRPMATKQRGALTDLDCNFNKLIFNATVCLAASAAGAAFDSLRLAECGGVAPPPLPVLAPLQFESSSQALRVVASGAHTAPGEFSTISAALAWRRSHVSSQPILLLRGTHFLAAPLKLGAADSGLQLLGEPGALLSGGVPLSDLAWERPTDGRGPAGNVWVAKVDPSLVDDIPSLFTHAPHRRLTRARFPNGDIETVQWGYDSPRQFEVALPGECRGCRPSAVDEWLVPPDGLARPSFAYVNLSDAHNPTGATKDDSAMERHVCGARSAHGRLPS